MPFVASSKPIYFFFCFSFFPFFSRARDFASFLLFPFRYVARYTIEERRRERGVLYKDVDSISSGGRERGRVRSNSRAAFPSLCQPCFSFSMGLPFKSSRARTRPRSSCNPLKENNRVTRRRWRKTYKSLGGNVMKNRRGFEEVSQRGLVTIYKEIWLLCFLQDSGIGRATRTDHHHGVPFRKYEPDIRCLSNLSFGYTVDLV